MTNDTIIITNNGQYDNANLFVNGSNVACITGKRITTAVNTKTKNTDCVFAYVGGVIVGQFHNIKEGTEIRDNRRE